MICEWSYIGCKKLKKKKKKLCFQRLAWGSLRQSYSTLRVLIGKQRMQIDTLVSWLSESWLLSRWQASICGLKPKLTRWLLEVRLSEVIKHTWAKRDSCKNNFLQNFAIETIVKQLRQPKLSQKKKKKKEEEEEEDTAKATF